MSRHALEIKALLESKKLSKSRFNPQTSIRLTRSPPSSIPPLKRSDSAASLTKKSTESIVLIEDRYHKLELNYRKVLEQTREKAVLFTKQKSNLEKLKLQSQKDKQQIQRLRAMLGFTKKQDFCVQVDLNSESKVSLDKDISKISAYSKGQQSTDAGSRETDETWNLKERKRVSRKQSHVKTPYKLMKNKSQTTIFFRSPLKESNMKTGNEKYKFVPTIFLN